MPVSEAYSGVYDISDDEEEYAEGLKIDIRNTKNREIVTKILEGKDVSYDAEELFKTEEPKEDIASMKSFREKLSKLQTSDADRIDLLSDTAEYISSMKFENMKSEMGDLLGNNKIFKKIIKPGAGECPPPKSLLTFHYASFCIDDDIDSYEPFDSSYLRDKPDRKRLGVGGLLPGIEFSLSSMKLGEESYFLIHPDYAFGERGVPPRILPNCWILFSTRLIRWTDCSGATEYERMTEDERKEAPWSKLKLALVNLKECGANAYRMGDLETAERLLRKARNWLLNARIENEETELDMHDISARIYRNLFIVLFKRGTEKHNKIALSCIGDTLQLKNVPKDILAQCHYYKGCIKRRFGDYDVAKDSLNRALRLMPKDQLVLDEIAALEADIRRGNESLRLMAKKAIGANMDDLPATGAAKLDNEEQALAEVIRTNNLKLDSETIDLIVRKLKEFRGSTREELILPDSWGFNIDFNRAVKAIAEMYGLVFDADDERQLFRVLKGSDFVPNV